MRFRRDPTSIRTSIGGIEAPSHANPQSQSPEKMQHVVRTLRLTSGLVLFAYATSHLLNHTFGIGSIAAMQAASTVLLTPWRTYPGLGLLYGSVLLHGMLGLYTLYRRRHLRMPWSEIVQLAFGLTIPVLLIPHAGALRLGHAIYGVDSGYARILYQLWISSPDFALPRQFFLVLIVWIHGCIGIRSWLRSYSWYDGWAAALASLMTLIPALALAGVVSAGLTLRSAVDAGAIDVGRFAPSRASMRAADIAGHMVLAYTAIVVAILIFRVVRTWYAGRGSVAIVYPHLRTIRVVPGFSILEASRWAGIPHESVCGGRGRCSTCRVRIKHGAESIPAPDALERSTLDRIRADPDIRLACQARPAKDIEVELLVQARPSAHPEAIRFDVALGGGRELEITAMFVDLRGSSKLAQGLLPYDALFLFDRYIQVVTGAIRAHGGHVTSIAGDGVMSVFAMDHKPDARAAMLATLDVWRGLDSLNSELAGELSSTLRVGIGLHSGPAVVGWVGPTARQSLQFLGDTGNVAAKLEEQAKILGCTVVVSTAALDAAGVLSKFFERASVVIPGPPAPLDVGLIRQRDVLERALSP